MNAGGLAAKLRGAWLIEGFVQKVVSDVDGSTVEIVQENPACQDFKVLRQRGAIANTADQRIEQTPIATIRFYPGFWVEPGERLEVYVKRPGDGEP